jgi:hypothetical protein
MVFCPLYQFLGEKFHFIDMVKADLLKFIQRNLMIKADHPVPGTRHFSHELGLSCVQNFLFKETPWNVLIFHSRISKLLGKNVPAKIEERFERPR